MKDERCEVLQDFTSEEQTFRQALRIGPLRTTRPR